MKFAQSQLALPLAALFIGFFIAPLGVLLALSLQSDQEAGLLTLGQYLKFFSDPFSYSVVWDTLLLGLKATLVCLVFGFPVAWLCARVNARWIDRAGRHPQFFFSVSVESGDVYQLRLSSADLVWWLDFVTLEG